MNMLAWHAVRWKMRMTDVATSESKADATASEAKRYATVTAVAAAAACMDGVERGKGDGCCDDSERFDVTFHSLVPGMCGGD